MNCKPGDIAVFVGGDFGGRNLGALFEVLDQLGVPPDEWRVRSLSAAVTDNGVRGPGHIGGCQDSTLRPIRPGDGTDETLVWAGRPEGVTA